MYHIYVSEAINLCNNR